MTTPAPPPGPGGYPQEPYYAPGWTTPVPSAPPPRRDIPWRRIVWIAATVVVLALAALVTFLVMRHLATRPLGEVDGPVQAHAGQLGVGHCIETLPEDGEVSRVPVVPCDDPHAAEVVGVHVLDDGEWPGARAVQREVAAACDMTSAQVEAGFSPVVWVPSQAGWSQGDQRGLCLAWSADGTVTGSWAEGTVAVD